MVEESEHHHAAHTHEPSQVEFLFDNFFIAKITNSRARSLAGMYLALEYLNADQDSHGLEAGSLV